MVMILLVVGAVFGFKNYKAYNGDSAKDGEKYYWLAAGIICSTLAFLYMIMYCCF
jgi:hypothetical protein